MTEPHALLGDLRLLRARTRADRHAYALPLLVFGGLILLAPLMYGSEPPPPPGVLVPAVTDLGPFPQFVPAIGNVSRPALIGLYWVLALAAGLALTAWWYRVRARRRGVETDVRVPVVAAAAALVGIVVWRPLLDAAAGGPTTLYDTPLLTLPLLLGSAALAAVPLTSAVRPQRTDTHRRAAVAAGMLLASLSFAALSVYLVNGYSALLAVSIALLALAWWERSVPLLVIALLFTLTSVPAHHRPGSFDPMGIYWGMGWMPFWDGQQAAPQYLLLPGLVLLVGGAVAALRHSSAGGRDD